MERVHVTSSNITEVGFDPVSNILEVLFSDGGLYHYFNVPESIYTGLLAAPSAGRFFHEQIRKVFRFDRV